MWERERVADQERKRQAKAPEPGKGNAVPTDAPESSRPFDLRFIKNLVALMNRHDLNEVDLREGDLRIRLRRGPEGISAVPPPPSGPPSQAAVKEEPPAATASPKSEKNLITIKSPTPGTFYASANPDAEPFVKIGSRVSPTTVVCIIEAMKIFNEIQAECSGVVAEIRVENQQAVEYGQVLFLVDPTK